MDSGRGSSSYTLAETAFFPELVTTRDWCWWIIYWSQDIKKVILISVETFYKFWPDCERWEDVVKSIFLRHLDDWKIPSYYIIVCGTRQLKVAFFPSAFFSILSRISRLEESSIPSVSAWSKTDKSASPSSCNLSDEELHRRLPGRGIWVFDSLFIRIVPPGMI